MCRQFLETGFEQIAKACDIDPQQWLSSECESAFQTQF